MKSSIKQSPGFVDLEEEEAEKIPSPIASPTRKILEIDPIQQEIYDYIEYLEQKTQGKVVDLFSNQVEILSEEIHFSPLEDSRIENALKEEIYELEVLNKYLK